MKKNFLILIFLFANKLLSDNLFPIWSSTPWDSGGINPNSVVWSMYEKEIDLDQDGKKEFLCITSWSDTLYNTVYLYENSGGNNFDIIWGYNFYGYSNDYSNVSVSDLDNDGRGEILCLIDVIDSTFHGFYVFEWNGTDNGFPSIPSTTWNLNLENLHESCAIVSDNLDTDIYKEVAVLVQESFYKPKTTLMIFSLDALSTFESPVWQIEFIDTTTFLYSGYSISSSDLDKDGKKEIVASGWDSTFHIAIYENSGTQNTYSRVNDLQDITSYTDFSNSGMIEANFDNNATNELYIATYGGSVFVLTNNGDISQTTKDNVYLLHQFSDGLGLIGITKGNIDGDSNPNIYVAGSYHEKIFDFEYIGFDVKTSSSYFHSVSFSDDTLDSITPNDDQGYFRPSKIAVGDFNSNGISDMVISSSSFARDKSILSVFEFNPLEVFENNFPNKFSLKQNFPNPFNPKTKIKYEIAKSGFVNLKVFDVLGREIKTLVNENKNVGTYEIDFDASHLNSGVYFYKLTTNDFSEMKEMILIK